MKRKPTGYHEIQDEFTHLLISRQRKKQLRYRRDGFCETGCGTATKSARCPKCNQKMNLLQRKRLGIPLDWPKGKHYNKKK